MFRPAWNNPYGFDESGSGDLALPRHDVDRSFRSSTYRGIAPTPANTTTDGSATAANAAVATKGSTFQALFTRSTYPE
jgi:hypothetical protein